MKAFLLAPFRCLVLVVLTLTGVLVAELGGVLIALIVTGPWIVRGNRWLANLGRRWSGAWGGVSIPVGYRPLPTEPLRREDGWYVHDNQLYRRPTVPLFLRRTEALSNDPSVIRDWLWLALTPLVGGLAVALPVALIGGGAVLAATRPGVAGYGGGAALVVGGVACAPFMLRRYALWSRVLLQPQAESWWTRSGFGRWLKRSWQAVWRGAALAGMSLGALGFGLLNLVTLVLSWGGLLPQTMLLSRPYLEHYRRRVTEWTGVPVDSPYRPEPAPPRPESSGQYRVGRFLHRDLKAAVRARRFGWVLRDPASWRDLLWTFTAPLPSPFSLAVAAVASFGFFGLVWQPLWWAPWAIPLGLIEGVWVTPWYVWYGLTVLVPALGVVPGWLSPLVGIAITGAAVLLASPLIRLRAAWDRLLLQPTRAAVLAQRVYRLTETRADATDAQAAEVRRIERDLHDGAQARLVALGMSLATVEQLLERDPGAARELLAQARETSVTALTELRDLVRGIHPPVLAERGLVDAVRAVALDHPLPVTVTAEVDGRLDAPVESAAYFAVCEALANATRHAGAGRVDIDLRHDGQRLHIRVTDDGRGGADPSRGSGLAGIARRLGTFDGVLTVSSPPGGPTVLTMEVPCALSSPKTSTS